MVLDLPWIDPEKAEMKEHLGTVVVIPCVSIPYLPNLSGDPRGLFCDGCSSWCDISDERGDAR